MTYDNEDFIKELKALCINYLVVISVNSNEELYIEDLDTWSLDYMVEQLEKSND